ncbi:MAG: hypothetical protein ACI3W8_06950 [Oscillospiraceae bacterium]
MELLQDTVIALLAAVGLTAVLWLVLKAVFAPRRELCEPVYLVLPVSGRTRAMEQAVGEMQQMRRQYGGAARAVLLDCGMEEEQRRMARILQREDPLLLLCSEEELKETLRSGR